MGWVGRLVSGLHTESGLGDVLVRHQCADGLWHPRPGDHADAPAHVRLSYSSDCAMTVLALAQYA